jgi:hypothetical protein
MRAAIVVCERLPVSVMASCDTAFPPFFNIVPRHKRRRNRQDQLAEEEW